MPHLGRWLNRAPIGEQDDLNLYAMVAGDPVNKIDPNGEFGLWGALIGGGLDLGLQLAMNGGNWKCVKWGSVAGSAALGAIGGGLTSGFLKGSFKFRRALLRAGKPPSYSWSATKHWAKKNNIKTFKISKDQQRHHWLFQQGQGWGRNVPDWLKNQPWNVNPVSSKFNNWMSNGSTNIRSLLGAPPWARGLAGGAGLGGISKVISGGNCGC